MTPEQKEKNYQLAEQLLAEQNFRKAAVFGLLATLAMTAIWVMIAAATGDIMGYMAIFMGAAVGYSVQLFGKGIRPDFAFLAGVLAIVGCVSGNILAVILIESIDHQMPVMEILSVITLRAIIDFIVVDFGLIDLAFWILAVSAAAYTAKRRLTHLEQLAIFTLKHTPRAQSLAS